MASRTVTVLAIGLLLVASVAADIDFVYHNYTELTRVLTETALQCPEIMQVYTVGHSVQGRELWVMEISDNLGDHEPVYVRSGTVGPGHLSYSPQVYDSCFRALLAQLWMQHFSAVMFP
ncbi:hypothetical protein Bbelb_259000 [Branchiostoma belcheri]|nr:hypothetical protein Bbelb_259000 [Branchiostoma belcheri]